jgi:hypothetical protein
VNKAKTENVTLTAPQEFRAISGHGLQAMVEGKTLLVGNRKLMSDNQIGIDGLAQAAYGLEGSGHTVVYGAVDVKLAGLIAIADAPRDDVDTPALLLDLDKFERNATKISSFLREHGVGWRPHSKAHKSPQVARRQMQLGAIGVRFEREPFRYVQIGDRVLKRQIARHERSRVRADEGSWI